MFRKLRRERMGGFVILYIKESIQAYESLPGIGVQPTVTFPIGDHVIPGIC